jgi:proteasome accessory factor B
MARNLARAHLGPQTAAAFDEIVAGVRSAVPEELSAFSDYCQAFFLTRPPIGKAAEPNETYLQNIACALAENRKLEIHYRPSEDRREDVHVVHPYFVPFVDGVPYVVGHSEQRGETRVFAMDRIRDLRVLDATFERPEEFRVEQLDPDEIWERSFKAFFRHGEPEGRTLVIIEFEPPMANIIRSRQWHPSQRIQRSANGHVTLSMMCAVTPDLKAWILSFGRHARVVEPRELAREIRAEHAAAARAR